MYTNMAYTTFDDKTQTNDRVLVLKAREGESTKTNTGMTDNRLFKGGNQAHAVMDTQTLLWTLRYEKGNIPEPLKQSFTSFKRLYEYVERYYNERGIDITEVKQHAPSSVYE